MTSFDRSSFKSKDPYFLPGHTGYVPGLKFVVGRTYGGATHDLVETPENALSQTQQLRLKEMRPEIPTTERDRRVRHRMKTHPNSVLTNTMVPGYTGHIPKAMNHVGHTFAVTNTKGIGDLVRECDKTDHQYDDLSETLAAQNRNALHTMAGKAKNPKLPPRCAPNMFTPRVTYSKTAGIPPHYTGHVPQQRHADTGVTFGKATRDSAAHLRKHCPVVNEPTSYYRSPGISKTFNGNLRTRTKYDPLPTESKPPLPKHNSKDWVFGKI